eukprot:TRINITY_DN28408_c0_g1_i1.p1 TRINITY_DN28408_c0_g1~~TRINITY_DN28408_c0_g1_i1.p1  ORF type:complete len:406 (+),score=56.90 TRINITY_DN28408_c0_g1_i1:67-1218(+)
MSPVAAQTPAAVQARAAICLDDILGDSLPDGACASTKKHGQSVKVATSTTFQPHHSRRVPKSANLVEQVRDGTTKSERVTTTIMLRNIPNKYTQVKLMQELDDCGYEGAYDFFYLPMDVHNRSNVGYAFINFLTPEVADKFRQEFSHHCFQRFHSRKVGTVCIAHVQGLDENLRHFQNRAVTHAKNDKYRPIVLRGKTRVDFDEALAEAKIRLMDSDESGASSAAEPKPEPAAQGRAGLETAIRDLLESFSQRNPPAPSEGASASRRGTKSPTSGTELLGSRLPNRATDLTEASAPRASPLAPERRKMVSLSNDVESWPAYVKLPSESTFFSEGKLPLKLPLFPEVSGIGGSDDSTPRTNKLFLPMSLDSLKVDVDSDVWRNL